MVRSGSGTRQPADGAVITVMLVGNRLCLRGTCPDGLSIYQWDAPEISVAADRGTRWIVSNLNRRLVPDLLDRHAKALVLLARQRDDEQAKAATCTQLREIIPAGVLGQPWPADAHDARWHGGGHHSGRVRVVSAGSVDVELNSLTPGEAARVLTALFRPGEPDLQPGLSPAGRFLAGFPQAAYPDVSSALLPRSEFESLGEAPTMVAPYTITPSPLVPRAWLSRPRPQSLGVRSSRPRLIRGANACCRTRS